MKQLSVRFTPSENGVDVKIKDNKVYVSNKAITIPEGTEKIRVPVKLVDGIPYDEVYIKESDTWIKKGIYRRYHFKPISESEAEYIEPLQKEPRIVGRSMYIGKHEIKIPKWIKTLIIKLPNNEQRCYFIE